MQISFVHLSLSPGLIAARPRSILKHEPRMSCSVAVCRRLRFLNCKLRSFRPTLLGRHIDIDIISTMQFVKFMCGRYTDTVPVCCRNDVPCRRLTPLWHIVLGPGQSSAGILARISQPRLISIRTIARAAMHQWRTRTNTQKCCGH